MPTNLEIKARIPSLSEAENIAKILPAEFKGVLKHRDIYFTVPNGRLKLREIDGIGGELIFYERSESENERWSVYKIYPTSNLNGLLSVLEAAFPLRGVVEKERKLYQYQNARIHFDAVKNLGTFLEFEVILDSTEEQAQQLMEELRGMFSVSDMSLIRCSYIDFM